MERIGSDQVLERPQIFALLSQEHLERLFIQKVQETSGVRHPYTTVCHRGCEGSSTKAQTTEGVATARTQNYCRNFLVCLNIQELPKNS